MMHGKKGGLAVVLAAGLAVGSLTGVAQAAIGGGDLAFPSPNRPGETAVGVQVTKDNPESLSYEVPLYVTLAVVREENGQTKVVPPAEDAYYIQNNSPHRPDGEETALAVTQVTVTSLKSGAWSLVNDTPDAPGELALRIGEFALPAIAAGGGAAPVTVETKSAGNSAFYKDGAYVQLTGGNRRLALPISGQAVAKNADHKPAAQFRVEYTVSMLDRDGDPIGSFVDVPARPQPE